MAATAAVIASVAVTGCGNGGNPPLTGSAAAGSAGPGSPAGGSPAAAPGSTCYQWSGLQALNGTALPLRTMASDEIAGAASDQLGGDSLAILAGVDGFKGKLQQLPASYAEAVENKVVWVALNSSSVSSDQLNTAAADAQDLASQISQLCLSSPS